MTHDAKIDWHKPPIGRNEYIAWMHVGMKKTVAEHLIEKAVCAASVSWIYIMAGSTEGCQIIDLNALNPFDDQHARGASFQIDPGDVDSHILAQIISQTARGGGFHPQIKFNVGYLNKLFNGCHQL